MPSAELRSAHRAGSRNSLGAASSCNPGVTGAYRSVSRMIHDPSRGASAQRVCYISPSAWQCSVLSLLLYTPPEGRVICVFSVLWVPLLLNLALCAIPSCVHVVCVVWCYGRGSMFYMSSPAHTIFSPLFDVNRCYIREDSTLSWLARL